MNDKMKTYDHLKITVLQKTVDPDRMILYACSLTQKKDLPKEANEYNAASLIRYLFTANHTSPFEHCVATFLIENVSRSFLAQITRHRMGSFTSASQHYTTYDEFPNVLDPQTLTMEGVMEFLDNCDEMYKHLISVGIPKEEARQVLPNAKAVNLIWTVNARSLINFFNQRMCKRNVNEMYYFAMRLRHVCMMWIPELFDLVGPDCEVLGGCTQGKMKAHECKVNRIPNFSR